MTEPLVYRDYTQAEVDQNYDQSTLVKNLPEYVARWRQEVEKEKELKMAEIGCTEAEIMAITGHKTSAMVSLYVRDASREKLAEAAILKLEMKTEEK